MEGHQSLVRRRFLQRQRRKQHCITTTEEEAVVFYDSLSSGEVGVAVGVMGW